MNTHANIRFTILLFAAMMVNAVMAQNSSRRIRTSNVKATQEQLLNSYSDSLKVYKQKLDSLMAANDSLRSNGEVEMDGKYFRYFAPLKYDGNVAGRMIGNSKETVDAGDAMMMSLYLRRPQLFASSQKTTTPTVNDGEKKPAEMKKPEQAKLSEQLVTQPVKDDKEQPLKVDNDLDIYVAKPNFWTFKGDYYLQFMQNHVSENWYKSGSNTYSMLGQVTLQYNYNNKQKVKWDNKLEMKLGFISSEKDTVNKFKASEDLLRYTSRLGLQAHKNWYYTTQLIAETQFTKGLKDNKTDVQSDFFSPFNLNVSLGMNYTIKTKNNRLSGTVNLAPLAYNFKFVGRKDLAPRFGIRGDHHSMNDFGSQVLAEVGWTPLTNFKWQTRFYIYTTYEKFLLECENTLTFKFNKYLSTVLFLYPRFDDSVKRKDEDKTFWQFKEYLSLGFNLSM